jgi:hypothetical protein
MQQKFFSISYIILLKINYFNQNSLLLGQNGTLLLVRACVSFDHARQCDFMKTLNIQINL